MAETKREEAREFIRANPKMTVDETMRALQIGRDTITRARTDLVKEGVIPPYNRRPRSSHFGRDTMLSEGPDLPGIVTPEELQEILSRKLRRAIKTEEVKGLASELIKLLPKPETGEENIGPGAPQTEEEMVERAGLILQALGADMSMRAVEWARASLHHEGTGLESPKEPGADNAEAVRQD